MMNLRMLGSGTLSVRHVAAGVAALMVLVSGAGLRGADPPLTVEEARRQIEEIRQLSGEATKRNVAAVYESVRRAASSQAAALEFYLDAVMRVQFSGMTKESTMLRDWRERHSAELDSRDYREALRLHLAYLALSIKRAADPEPAAWLDELRQFSEQILSADEEVLAVKPWMTAPIGSTVVARAYGIDTMLPGGGWEMVAGNADGMIEKAVLPVLRKAGDPVVVQYWDNRIKREGEMAAEADRAFARQVFEQMRLPELHWLRAREMRDLGLTDQALREMLLVMQKYPAHPSLDAWLGEVEKMIENMSSPAGGAGS